MLSHRAGVDSIHPTRRLPELSQVGPPPFSPSSLTRPANGGRRHLGIAVDLKAEATTPRNWVTTESVRPPPRGRLHVGKSGAPLGGSGFAGISIFDVEVSGGPSGIRTQDRRIKSQWLQLQNSLKTASKNRETAGKQLKTAGKRQVSGHLPDTKWQQWQHLKKRGKCRPQAKRAHMC